MVLPRLAARSARSAVPGPATLFLKPIPAGNRLKYREISVIFSQSEFCIEIRVVLPKHF